MVLTLCMLKNRNNYYLIQNMQIKEITYLILIWFCKRVLCVLNFNIEKRKKTSVKLQKKEKRSGFVNEKLKIKLYMIHAKKN